MLSLHHVQRSSDVFAIGWTPLQQLPDVNDFVALHKFSEALHAPHLHLAAYSTVQS